MRWIVQNLNRGILSTLPANHVVELTCEIGAAKEEADQTASAAAAAVPAEPKLAEEAKGAENPASAPVNATENAEEVRFSCITCLSQ